jgi:molybdopterin molybdotransferase
MLRVEEAQARVLEAAAPLGPEIVGLDEALGRVLASDVIATRALPPADTSAMDGYALVAADAATPGADLSVVGTIAAGHPSTRALARGQAMRIMTGAPLPPGADAVVMQEETLARGDRVVLQGVTHAGAHVRRRGEDVAPDTLALAAGTAIGPGEIGLLAALGRSVIPVHRRPTVSIVSTGDELVDIGTLPGPGQIVDSNAHALAAMIRDAGGRPWAAPITPDQPEAIRRRLTEALAADVLITVGGVSVGEFDYVKDALTAVGAPLDFWKVAMKPGKPMAFGCAAGRPAFGLPGNPASAMVSFELFVRPVLRKLAGRRSGLLRPRAAVRFEGSYRKETGRRHYLRAHARREGSILVAHPRVHQGSGMLRSMVDVNALVEIAEDVTHVEKNAELPALLLEGV